MSFDTISRIDKRQVGGGFQFTAHVAGDGKTAAVPVVAGALQTYRAFQLRILVRTGELFAVDAYEGKRGAREWRNDLADLLDQAAEVAS